jgi:hypothetical protein
MATDDSRGLPFASVGMNQGIVSSGDYASNQIVNMGSIPAAEQVLAPRGLFQVPLGQGSVFVGREHDIRSLDTRAAGPGIMVLTGREGIGKTALAHAYARRSIGRFSPVWWIEASNRDQIEESLAAIASQLEPVLAAAPVEVGARWAQSWLNCHDGWLIVMDGAPRPADLSGFLADSGHGTYVITSRQSTGWDRVGQVHELRELDPESAEQLMYALAGNAAKAEPRQVRAICERLGYFPAGVEAAATHMARTGTSPDAYLKAMQNFSVIESFGGQYAQGLIEFTTALQSLRERRGVTDQEMLERIRGILSAGELRKHINPEFLSSNWTLIATFLRIKGLDPKQIAAAREAVQALRQAPPAPARPVRSAANRPVTDSSRSTVAVRRRTSPAKALADGLSALLALATFLAVGIAGGAALAEKAAVHHLGAGNWLALLICLGVACALLAFLREEALSHVTGIIAVIIITIAVVAGWVMARHSFSVSIEGSAINLVHIGKTAAAWVIWRI